MIFLHRNENHMSNIGGTYCNLLTNLDNSYMQCNPPTKKNLTMT